MIYFVQAETGGPIKIGFTGMSLEYRLRRLQWASPYPFRVLGTCDGNRDQERKILRTFQHHRLRGEWFHPHAEILDFIDGLSAASRSVAA